MGHLKEEVIGRNNVERSDQKISWRKTEWTKQAQFKAKQLACVRSLRNHYKTTTTTTEYQNVSVYLPDHCNLSEVIQQSCLTVTINGTQGIHPVILLLLSSITIDWVWLLIHEVSRLHTTTHQSRQDSSVRVISSSQRPLPDNTQQSQQTNIHAPRGIRTQNLIRRAAADLRLKPRGHWDRRKFVYFSQVMVKNDCSKISSYELLCMSSLNFRHRAS